MDYILHLLVVLSLYSILAASLDLLVGYLGLLSVAHAAFFGVGAYVSALAGLRLGFSFPSTFFFSVATCAILSVLLFLPVASLRGDSLMLSTLCIQVLAFNVFLNWQVVTGGAQGLRQLPPPVAFGFELRQLPRFALLSLALASLSVLATNLVARGSHGRLLKTIREDEVFAQSVGRRPRIAKIAALAFSAALAGLAGSLFAAYYGYVSPSSFGLMESVLILSMVILGGAGKPMGPLAGVVILVMLPEGLRFLGLPPSAAAHLRQLVYGLLLIGMVGSGTGLSSQWSNQRASP